MKRPPHGICLPVIVEKVHDGDTVYVRLRGAGDNAGVGLWHVRLLDCWAPELKGPLADRGAAARDYLKRLVADSRDVSLFIPLPDAENLLGKLTTMGRVLGRLFVGHIEVSEQMVAAGHATREKLL